MLLKNLASTGTLNYINWYVGRDSGDRNFKIPIIRGLGYQNMGKHEPWVNRAIGTLLPINEGAFLDVGVNIGQTFIKVEEHSFGREYFGFEPNPSCIQYVSVLRSINKIPHAELIPVGLGEKDQIAKLYLRTTYDREASVKAELRGEDYYDETIYVVIRRGDEVIAELNIDKVSILKVDVEGSELEVFRGLEGTINEKRPFILCEILPIYNEHTDNGKLRRTRVDEIQRLFKNARYQLLQLFDDGQIKPLQRIETHSNLKLRDYLVVPQEKLSQVLERFKAEKYSPVRN